MTPGVPERSARDAALERVAENSGTWFELARAAAPRAVGRIPPPFRGEDLRDALTVTLGPPHNPHVWGCLVRALVRDGVLVPTGRWIQMRSKGSHARRTPQYVAGGKP